MFKYIYFLCLKIDLIISIYKNKLIFNLILSLIIILKIDLKLDLNN